MRRLPTLLILILVAGFVVAGCGGDDDKSSDKGADTATTEAETTADEAKTDAAAKEDAAKKKAATEDAGDNSSNAESGGQPSKAKPGEIRRTVVKNCKKSARGVRGVSEESKQRLEALCDKATDTKQPSVSAQSREICLDQLKNSGLTGAGAEAARKQCESLGQ